MPPDDAAIEVLPVDLALSADARTLPRFTTGLLPGVRDASDHRPVYVQLKLDAAK